MRDDATYMIYWFTMRRPLGVWVCSWSVRVSRTALASRSPPVLGAALGARSAGLDTIVRRSTWGHADRRPAPVRGGGASFW